MLSSIRIFFSESQIKPSKYGILQNPDTLLIGDYYSGIKQTKNSKNAEDKIYRLQFLESNSFYNVEKYLKNAKILKISQKNCKKFRINFNENREKKRQHLLYWTKRLKPDLFHKCRQIAMK